LSAMILLSDTAYVANQPSSQKRNSRISATAQRLSCRRLCVPLRRTHAAHVHPH
jgi:hypothetical protein